MATAQTSDPTLDYVAMKIREQLVNDESRTYRVVLPNIKENDYMNLLERLVLFDEKNKDCTFFRTMYPIGRVESDMNQDCYEYRFEDTSIGSDEWLKNESLAASGKRVSWASLERLLKRISVLSAEDKKHLRKEAKHAWESSKDKTMVDRVRSVLALLRIRPARCLTKRFVGTFKHDESVSIINKLNKGDMDNCFVCYEKTENMATLDNLYVGHSFQTPEIKRLHVSDKKNASDLTIENSFQVLFRLHEDCGLVFGTSVDGVAIHVITRCIHEHRLLHMIPKVHPPRYEVVIQMECSKRIEPNVMNRLATKYAKTILFVLKTSLVQPNILLKNQYLEVQKFIRTLQQHVSLRKPHTLTLETALMRVTNQYAVTAKADGERYWFCCLNGTGYLVSVKGKFMKICSVPVSLNETVLDGELIWIQDENRYAFLAFDILYHKGVNVAISTLQMPMHLHERLKLLDETLVELGYPFVFHEHYTPGKFGTTLDLKKINQEMLENLKTNQRLLRESSQEFVFLRKYYAFPVGEYANDVYRLIDAVWTMYEANSQWDNDGIILTPIQQDYNAGPRGHPEFKLKPLRLMSIDFLLKIQSRQNTGRALPVFDATLPDYDRTLPLAERPQYCVGFLHVVKQQQTDRRDADKVTMEFRREMGDHQVHLKLNPKTGLPQAMNGDVIQSDHVVEFIWKNDTNLPRERRWIPLRVRYDKTVGNGVKNADTIFNIITHPNQQVTFADIKELCGLNFSAVKQRMYQRTKQILSTNKYKHQGNNNAYQDFITLKKYIVQNAIAKTCAPVQTLQRLKRDASPPIRHKRVIDVNFNRSYLEFYISATVECLLGVFGHNVNAEEKAIIKRSHVKTSEQHKWKYMLHIVPGNFAKLMSIDHQSTQFNLTTEERKIYRHELTERPTFDTLLCLEGLEQYFKSNVILAMFLDNIQRCVVVGGYVVLIHLDAEALLAEPRTESSDSLKYCFMDETGNLKPVVQISFENTLTDASTVTTGSTIRLVNTMSSVEQQQYLVNHSYLVKMMRGKRFICVDSLLFRDFYKRQEAAICTIHDYQALASDIKQQIRLKAMKQFLTRQSMLAQAIRSFTGLFRCTVFMRIEK